MHLDGLELDKIKKYNFPIPLIK